MVEVQQQTASRKAPSSPVPALSVVEPHARPDGATHRGPALVVVAVVLLAAVGYAAAAQLVEMPLVNPDELRYTIGARGLVHGEWLNLRGESYGYGPVYPLLLAPILALSGNVETAYPFFKLLDALLFSLTAVPAYFLARRLLPPWWGVAVAAATVAVPSSIYTSLVMTESVAYLTSTTALLAVVLALERPSVPRQLAMLGCIGLAYATRPQFAALLLAYVAASLLLWVIPAERPSLRAALRRLWPSVGAVALVLAVLGARLMLTRSSPSGSLGDYAELWRAYDVDEVARFFVYHVAGWEVYLFVIPFVVAPVVLADLLRRARRGGEREGAFAAAFLTVNVVMALIAGAFASTPFGYSALHDRYLFYVAPLWFVTFAVWLARGLPRPALPTAIGAVSALALAAVLPFGLIGGNVVAEEVPVALWSWVWDTVEGTPHLDGRRVFALTVVALVVAAVALPRRVWPVLPALVGAGLIFTSGLAWDRLHDRPVAFAVADQGSRGWVDAAVPAGARVTKLYVSPPACPYTELTRQALFITEFFNTSVDRVAGIAGSTPDGLPVESTHVGPGGRLLRANGSPLVADYLVTQPEIHLVGQQIAHGTGANLVLWKTGGPVRLADPRLRTADLTAGYCQAQRSP